MKWFAPFLVVIFSSCDSRFSNLPNPLRFIQKVNAIPAALQGFGTGDQTTGDSWPPNESVFKNVVQTTGDSWPSDQIVFKDSGQIDSFQSPTNCNSGREKMNWNTLKVIKTINYIIFTYIL